MRDWKIVAGSGAALLIGLLLATQAEAGWFRHHRSHGMHDPDRMAEHANRAVEHLLSEVDASDEQQLAAREIVDRTVAAFAEVRFDRRALHGQVVELLSAESVDREAVENLRAEQLAAADRASRVLTEGLVELAEILTPEQRAQLHDLGHGRHGWH